MRCLSPHRWEKPSYAGFVAWSRASHEAQSRETNPQMAPRCMNTMENNCHEPLNLGMAYYAANANQYSRKKESWDKGTDIWYKGQWWSGRERYSFDRGWQQWSLQWGGVIGEEPGKIGFVSISRVCVCAPGLSGVMWWLEFQAEEGARGELQNGGAWDVFRKLLMVESVRKFTFCAYGRRGADKAGREN